MPYILTVLTDPAIIKPYALVFMDPQIFETSQRFAPPESCSRLQTRKIGIMLKEDLEDFSKIVQHRRAGYAEDVETSVQM